ncbi:MAG: cation diffusion facilitator family transporter, partial [Bacteroidetes bacterium]|nr:cation diffusion facilitator family transporter [Bacteroidota bacterium]
MTAEKRRVALTSVFAAILLTTMKLLVGLWTGSLGILSEALHSALDLLAAMITFFAVRVADRPPDADHQFGHGKIENLSALVETLLLLATCGWILYEAYDRLSTGGIHVDVNVWAFVVIGISIVVDISRSRALMRVARKYNSQALEADALHFSTDIYSSLVVLVGLVSVLIGFPEADAIAAAVVAGIVIWISLR